jgi:hypothetical protein
MDALITVFLCAKELQHQEGTGNRYQTNGKIVYLQRPSNGEDQMLKG